VSSKNVTGTAGHGWTRDITEEEWAAAVETLRRACAEDEPIALACHEDPDGDALGSLLALHLFLRKIGCESVASWGSDPFAVPPQYTFLPGLQTLSPPRDIPDAPRVLVCLDAATPGRLGSLQPLVDRAETVIVVDHHSSGDRFGDINLTAPRAAATVLLVDELIRRLGGRPDRDIASCLYTGLVTDTGRFQSRATDTSAMELGGRLLAEGIEHEQMSRQMFDTHSFGYLKVLGRVLDRSTFVPEAGLVYAWLEHADLERFGTALEETEGVIDVLRTAEAAEVVMVMKQLADGGWKTSLRSKDRADVSEVAQLFGGGGHIHSAAFVAQADREEIVKRIVEHLARRRAERG
jgi:bifunctional oligoribonuclease and PAP phosphatase NrnA